MRPVKEITEIVTKFSGDLNLTEAAGGGGGLSGRVFGRKEFAALTAKTQSAK